MRFAGFLSPKDADNAIQEGLVEALFLFDLPKPAPQGWYQSYVPGLGTFLSSTPILNEDPVSQRLQESLETATGRQVAGSLIATTGILLSLLSPLGLAVVATGLAITWKQSETRTEIKESIEALHGFQIHEGTVRIWVYALGSQRSTSRSLPYNSVLIDKCDPGRVVTFEVEDIL